MLNIPRSSYSHKKALVHCTLPWTMTEPLSTNDLLFTSRHLETTPSSPTFARSFTNILNLPS